MKFRTIFSFEFAYLMGLISTRVYIAVLVVFTIAMNVLITPGDGVYANNTFHITGITVVGGLIWLIMGASIAGEAAARDVKTRMHQLAFTTPVTKLDYFGGRFLAALAVNALLILCLPLGVMLSFYLPGMDQEELLPFRPWAYLNVYLLVGLPMVFVATTLQFSMAVLTRQVMTSYVASLALAIVAQIMAMALANLFDNPDLVILLDPIGIAGILGSELSTWTPTEKNTRLLTLDGMLLWNRMLWITVAIVTLTVTYHRYKRYNTETKNWQSVLNRPRNTSTSAVVNRTVARTVPQLQRRSLQATCSHQVIRIGWASFKTVAGHPLGITIVALVAILSAVFSDLIMTQFSIPLMPTTQQVLTYLANPVSNLGTPWLIIPILIVYFTGSLTWQERDAGINDIVDASPVAEWVLLTGKFIGTGLTLVVWLALMMAGGMAMQSALGYHQMEISLYLKTLFGIQFLEYALFAFVSLVVHVVVNQKYIGYLIMLLLFMFLAFPSTFKIEHKMLIFGAAPAWTYTDMRGFGTSLEPWLWFKVYWLAWALLLAVVARLLWVRGRELTLQNRLGLVHQRMRSLTKAVTIVAMLFIPAAGSYIFYNTNVINGYKGSSEINQQKATYERRYGIYRNTPQPQLTGTRLHVEIYPDRQQAKIHAVYTLLNNHTVAIDSIHLGNVPGITLSAVTFNRPTTAVVIDENYSHQIYKLAQPLQPGDSMQLGFDVHHEEKGFSNNGKKGLIVKGGSYFTNFDLLPSIGYQSHRELNDPVIRKKHQLVRRSAIPSLYNPEARNKPAITDQNNFEAIIGTSKGEVAVGPGHLLKTRTAGNRHYFYFKTDRPLRGEYAIVSGKYAVRKTEWNGVAISLYYYPGHNLNIDPMIQSIKASMAYYTGQFGPYPFRHLTITERAGVDGGAGSEATMIDYGEQFSLLNPDVGPNGFNLPFYIMAHEVAHQWWGGASLRPANVEGAGVLIEGLAVYSGMQVLEKHYGHNHLRKYLNFLHSFYEMPRSLATPPLLQADQAFLYYRKSGLAMYALSRYIGKEKVNGALRRLLQKHHSGALPLPTTLDLYRELEQVTPDSLVSILHDLFKKNTYWRLKTKKLTTIQNEDGTWQVMIKLEAHKIEIDMAGNEHELPMNDLLEVGLYEKNNGSDKPIYLQLHRIRSGEQTVNVTTLKRPDSGGIDPNYLMIDLRLDDNIMQLPL